MQYAVIINYFGKKISNQEKTGVNNCFKPLILSVFTIVASRLNQTERKGKINLETKYNMI